MPRVLASTTSHKREALMPTLEVFARLGLLELDLNLHHILELGEDPDRVVRSVEAAGQRVFVVSGGWCDFFHPAPRSDDTDRSVDWQAGIAERLGASTLRLFFGRLSAEEWSPAALKTAAGNIVRIAERHPRMVFVFENHDGVSLNPAVCRDILARVNRPTIRMNFDPINFERAGVASGDAFALLQPWIGHMHLKGVEKGEYCAFGEGDVDLTPVLRTLLQGGYNGAFTVEYEGRNDGTLRLYQSVARARDVLSELSRLP